MPFTSSKAQKYFKNIKNIPSNHRNSIVENDIAAEVPAVEADTAEELLWSDGRRIVDLKVLAEGLRKCANCESKLCLSDIISESRCGYGSHLIIKCICGTDNKVSTGTMHHSVNNKGSHSHTGRAIFYINTKVAGAMIHSGIGAAALRRFMHKT